MRGIALLVERGLPLKLKTVAVTINRHEIAGHAAVRAASWGVEFKFDGMINARIDCSHSPLEVRLPPAEMVELDSSDPVRARRVGELVASAGRRPVGADASTVYHCGGGISAFAIDPEGKMSICVLSRQDSFDLRAGSFEEGWRRGFLAKVRAKKMTRHTKCNDCQIRELCSACAATAELEHGDAEAPVDYFCEVAHLRAHAVGFIPARARRVRVLRGRRGATRASLAQVEAPPQAGAARRGRRARSASLPVVSARARRPAASGGGCGAAAAAEGTRDHG